MNPSDGKKPLKAKKTGSESPRRTKAEERKSIGTSTESGSFEPINELKQIEKMLDGTLPRKLRSEPLYMKGAVALAEKVKGRKPLKPGSRESLSSDEIIYPFSYDENVKKKSVKKRVVEPFPPGIVPFLKDDTCAGIVEMKGVRVTRLPYSRMPIVTSNNCNNNQLFVDNMPFWWDPMPSDITDDEIVMNAAVIIEVLENRLDLVPMPDIEIVLDPMQEVSILQRRDAQCFTKDIVFGNTVRSMVNMNELSLRELQERSVRKFRKKSFPINPNKNELETLHIKEPIRYTLYSRNDYNEKSVEDFTPTKRGRYSKEMACDLNISSIVSLLPGTLLSAEHSRPDLCPPG
ncbi:hypothetical protein RB195_004092 [Necator americanus]